MSPGSAALCAYLKEPQDPTLERDLEIDKLFGIDSLALAQEESRRVMPSPEQVGIGSDPKGMWSPYHWLHAAFSELGLEGKHICDIGAGIGRLDLYFRVFHPHAKYLGLELLPSRVKAARRAGVNVVTWDVGTKGAVDADVYYFYNSLPEAAYSVFIHELKMKIELKQSFLLVSSRDPYDQFKTFLTEKTRIRIDVPFHHDIIIYGGC